MNLSSFLRVFIEDGIRFVSEDIFRGVCFAPAIAKSVVKKIRFDSKRVQTTRLFVPFVIDGKNGRGLVE